MAYCNMSLQNGCSFVGQRCVCETLAQPACTSFQSGQASECIAVYYCRPLDALCAGDCLRLAYIAYMLFTQT